MKAAVRITPTEVSHRVVRTGCEQDGQRLRDHVDALFFLRAEHALEHTIIGIDSEPERTERIGRIPFQHLVIAGNPVRLRAGRPELFVKRSECQAVHQPAAVMPPPADCHQPAEPLPEHQRCFRMVGHGSHEDHARQAVAVHLDVLPHQRGAHAVPQHEIRHVRIFLCRALAERMHIPQHTDISVFFIEETVLRCGLYGFPVSEMVISHDIPAPVAEVLCKCIVSCHIFHHTMADLKDGLRAALGLPLDRMDLGIAVF